MCYIFFYILWSYNTVKSKIIIIIFKKNCIIHITLAEYRYGFLQDSSLNVLRL